MIVIEDILGRCAPALGLTPASCGGATSTQPGRPRPYGQPVRHPERIERAWSAGAGRPATWIGGWSRSRRSTPTHEHTKRGLAHHSGQVRHLVQPDRVQPGRRAACTSTSDGSVLINHGGTEMGQGLHTKMLQVAATALGVPLSTVRLAPTRTDKVPNTSATAASSGADLNGGAVKNACEQIRGPAGRGGRRTSSACTRPTCGSSTAW